MKGDSCRFSRRTVAFLRDGVGKFSVLESLDESMTDAPGLCAGAGASETARIPLMWKAVMQQTYTRKSSSEACNHLRLQLCINEMGIERL